MASDPLQNLFATTIGSEHDDNKAATINEMARIIDAAIAGRLVISTTGGTTTLSGTPSLPQAQNIFLDISGTLASSCVIEIPVSITTGRNRVYIVKNGTSGAFTLTVKAVGGTGVTVGQGNTAFLLYNGTDIQYAAPQIVSSTGAIAAVSSPTFIAPTLLNSWVNYGAPLNDAGYALHLGVVRLRGVIKTGTVNTAGFVLPAGYRPTNNVILIAMSNDATGRLDVQSNGNVIIASGSVGSNAYFSLDGLSFIPS